MKKTKAKWLQEFDLRFLENDPNEFIEGAKNSNTKKKTDSDMKLWKRFLEFKFDIPLTMNVEDLE